MNKEEEIIIGSIWYYIKSSSYGEYRKIIKINGKAQSLDCVDESGSERFMSIGFLLTNAVRTDSFNSIIAIDFTKTEIISRINNIE